MLLRTSRCDTCEEGTSERTANSGSAQIGLIKMAAPRIIVIGGGLAGLAAVIKIAESGGNVDLFSIVPVKRSHSVCAQGGINAAKNLKGEATQRTSILTTRFMAATFLPISRR